MTMRHPVEVVRDRRALMEAGAAAFVAAARAAIGGHERQEAGMQVGMIGLGRMGANMVRRLLRGGHRCMVHAFLGGLRLWNGVPARPARRG